MDWLGIDCFSLPNTSRMRTWPGIDVFDGYLVDVQEQVVDNPQQQAQAPPTAAVCQPKAHVSSQPSRAPLLVPRRRQFQPPARLNPLTIINAAPQLTHQPPSGSFKVVLYVFVPNTRPCNRTQTMRLCKHCLAIQNTCRHHAASQTHQQLPAHSSHPHPTHHEHPPPKHGMPHASSQPPQAPLLLTQQQQQHHNPVVPWPLMLRECRPSHSALWWCLIDLCLSCTMWMCGHLLCTRN